MSRQWYGCQFPGLPRMLMRAIAHWGCQNTVRESALKVVCGRKIPFRSVAANRINVKQGAALDDA